MRQALRFSTMAVMWKRRQADLRLNEADRLGEPAQQRLLTAHILLYRLSRKTGQLTASVNIGMTR